MNIGTTRRPSDAPHGTPTAFGRDTGRLTPQTEPLAARVVTPDVHSALLSDLAGPIVEAAPIALIVVAHGGKIALVNAETEHLLGYSREEMLGRNVEMLVPERFRMIHIIHRNAYFAHPRARAMSSGIPLHARQKDGTEIPVEIALKPMQTPAGSFVLCIVADISERKRMEAAICQARNDLERRVAERTEELARVNRANEVLLADLQAQRSELERQSREDPLTQLDNRRAFDERLYNEMRRAERFRQPLATAMLDLDHFKRVNDRFGHAVGDAVLREAANILRQECRAIDIISRYGGEEFALALPGSDLRAGVILCERIRWAFERFPWGRIIPGLLVTISAGVSTWRPGVQAHTLLAAADRQLYSAKNHGRNRVLPELPTVSRSAGG